MEVDEHEMAWKWPTTLPTPTVEGDTRQWRKRMRGRGVIKTFVGGLVIGGLAVFLGVQLERMVWPSPRTDSRGCAGAQIEGTLFFVPQSRAILAQITVSDERGRDWYASWGGYASTYPEAKLLPVGGKKLVGVTQLLGDTDDGLTRTVVVRPAEDDQGCSLRLGFAHGILS